MKPLKNESEVKCIMCGNSFFIRIGGKRPVGKRKFRQKQSVTCSKICSNKYKRIRAYVLNNQKKVIKSSAFHSIKSKEVKHGE